MEKYQCCCTFKANEIIKKNYKIAKLKAAQDFKGLIQK